MASRRYYDSARSIGSSRTSTIKRQSDKRKDAIHRGRQIRDAMSAASIAFRPGGYNNDTRAIRTEKKVIDGIQAIYNVENTGTTVILVNGCIPGSQNYNRIGRKINSKSLQIHGFLIIANQANAVEQKVRMLVVYDKQSNGVAPTYANVIQSQNIAGTTSSTINDMVNLDNRDRFEIIRDRLFYLGGQNTTATQTWTSGPNLVTVDEYIPLGNRETLFNAGAAGTIGDIASGAIYVMLISSQPNATGCNFYSAFRVRFVDM